MISYGKNSKRLTIILFLLPSLFGLIFFSLTPMVSSFFISLTNWDVISGSPKILGFSNYLNILQGEEFWRTLKNTLYFIVLYIPLMLLVSLSVANLLNSAYFGNIRTLFPVTSGQYSGIIRTAFRHIRTPCRIIK